MINIAEDRPSNFAGTLQTIFVSVSLWWLMPLVLYTISFWLVKKHAPILSYFIGIMPMLGTCSVIYFRCQYENIKRKTQDSFGKEIKSIGEFKKGYKDKSSLAYGILTLSTALLIFIPFQNAGMRIQWFGYPDVFTCFKIKLSNQILITEPDKDKDFKDTFWEDLEGVHLEGANLNYSVLKRANLRHAKLQRANLVDTNLKKANLERASLHDTNFRKANLEGASFVGANLMGAKLGFANIQGASLMFAKLVGAERLTIEQLSKVITLHRVELDPELMKQVKEKYPRLLEESKVEEPKPDE